MQGFLSATRKARHTTAGKTTKKTLKPKFVAIGGRHFGRQCILQSRTRFGDSCYWWWWWYMYFMRLKLSLPFIWKYNQNCTNQRRSEIIGNIQIIPLIEDEFDFDLHLYYSQHFYKYTNFWLVWPNSFRQRFMQIWKFKMLPNWKPKH